MFFDGLIRFHQCPISIAYKRYTNYKKFKLLDNYFHILPPSDTGRRIPHFLVAIFLHLDRDGDGLLFQIPDVSYMFINLEDME